MICKNEFIPSGECADIINGSCSLWFMISPEGFPPPWDCFLLSHYNPSIIVSTIASTARSEEKIFPTAEPVVSPTVVTLEVTFLNLLHFMKLTVGRRCCSQSEKALNRNPPTKPSHQLGSFGSRFPLPHFSESKGKHTEGCISSIQRAEWKPNGVVVKRRVKVGGGLGSGKRGRG